MYFDNFNTLLYEFPTIGSNKSSDSIFIKDITTNIRFKKEFIENLPLIETYKIVDGDTPEIISEKLYGTPDYHWILMLLNQRYDYINDFPLNGIALEFMIANKYGDSKDMIKHFKNDNGNIVNGYCYITISKSVEGNIEYQNNQTKIIGYGTSFIDDLSIGNNLYTKDGTLLGSIKSITSNEELELFDKTNLPDYLGTYVCEIPIAIGDVIRNTTSIGYAIGVVQEITTDGRYGILLTSLSFRSGDDIEILTYGDDVGGNYKESSKGVCQLISLSYPELLNFVTNTTYEYILNEQSRELKVLPSLYLGQVLNEFKSLMLK